MRIKCDVHTWMNAWVFVADTPFAAVTDQDGRFAFRGVAPGTYRLEDVARALRREVAARRSSRASGVAQADVTLSLLDASN